jgi:Domain found in Dishevelled, Egl-10, and Pleckstrin (DEP)
MPPATLLVSLVGNHLDPILSAVATSRKALYQRVPTVAALQQQLSSPAALERVVLIELSQLSIPGSSPRDTLRRITQLAPEMRIVVVASQAKTLFVADRKWLEVSPHVTVLSGITPRSWHASGKPLFEALFGQGDFSTELRRVEPFIKALDQHAAATAIDLAHERKIDYVSAAHSMVSPRGIVVGDRRYRLKLYPEVFVCREAYVWLQRILLMSAQDALIAGQATQEAGLIYHVVREQAFADEEFFFRVAGYPADFSWVSFLNSFFGKDGPARKDRTYHAKTYPMCLQGQETFDWMRAKGFTENEAMTIGQRMIDLNLIHHVADEQPFRADNLFFRALHDENAQAQPLAAANPQYKAV